MVDYEVGGTWYKLNDWLGIEWNRWGVEDKKILRECTPLIVYLLKYLWNKEVMDGSITVNSFSFLSYDFYRWTFIHPNERLFLFYYDL